jgi:hypothetical protein
MSKKPRIKIRKPKEKVVKKDKTCKRKKILKERKSLEEKECTASLNKIPINWFTSQRQLPL